MDKCSRKNVSFSRSGFSVLNRKLEQKLEIIKDSLSRKDAWVYVAWSSNETLDNFVGRGCYVIDGKHSGNDAGFPVVGGAAGGDFSAILMVVDSTPVGTTRGEGILGQFLVLTDKETQKTGVYTRTNTYASGKNNWSVWSELGEKVSIENKLQKLEQKVFPLEVTLSVDPPETKEYTGAAKEFTLSWTVKIAGETVTPSSVVLKVGDETVPVDKEDTSKIVSATDDKKVELTIEADGRIAIKTANINFARRYYSAVVDGEWEPTNDTIKKLAKKELKTAAAATVTYSAATQKKIVFAYPASHGTMSTIKDAYGNSMFTLNDGGKTFNTAPETVEVTLSGGAKLSYYVYESAVTNVTAGNITYTTKSYD